MTVKTEGTPLIVGIVLTVVIVVTEVTVLTIVAIMKAHTFAAEPLILPYGEKVLTIYVSILQSQKVNQQTHIHGNTVENCIYCQLLSVNK